jgi:hypothetical protein
LNGWVVASLAARFDLIVALATIYRSIFAGLKGDFGVFAALSAYNREHSPLGPVAIAEALCLPGLPARWAPLGVVGVAFGGEELLLLSAECEIGPTISTLDCLVGVTHLKTSSFWHSVELR